MRAAGLRLQIGPSMIMAAVLSMLHAAGVACAFACVPGWATAAAISAVLAASLAFHLRHEAFLTAGDAVVELALKDANRCELRLRDGRILAGTLDVSTTFVSPLLVVVNMRTKETSRRQSVVLLPDSAAPNDQRELRIWLRHRTRAGIASSEPSGPL